MSISEIDNLVTFGKHQLSQMTSTSKLKFKLPQLKLKNNDNNLVSTSSLSEYANDQLKAYTGDKRNFPMISSEEPKIDLTSALLLKREQKDLQNNLYKTPEKFVPSFINCESKFNAHEDERNSDIFSILSSISLKKLRHDECSMHQPSMMGKVIGRRFKLKAPLISSFVIQNSNNRFTFNVLSPDDQILKNLRK